MVPAQSEARDGGGNEYCEEQESPSNVLVLRLGIISSIRAVEIGRI